MKALFGILMATCLVLAAVVGVSYGVQRYVYVVRVGQYLRLADDASLPILKRDYLMKYKDAVITNIQREDACYCFKQKRLTRTAQLTNLDSLIQRLNDIATLTPDSLAYQQGMQQITGQEFDHTMGEINKVFYDCYSRAAFFTRYAAPVICCILVVASLLFGIGLAVVWND
jgi:lipopolysaccharide export LptBFGC system permease protein LptF